MDDKTLALLGDKSAQERLTERGELLPCPFCHGKTGINGIILKWGSSGIYEHKNTGKCMLDGFQILRIAEWNHRAPILTPEKIKRLEALYEKN